MEAIVEVFVELGVAILEALIPSRKNK